jgi:glycosyltransferase involved in cell wall biosynthesis
MVKEQPLLSILMPVYNAEKYIDIAIKSLKQNAKKLGITYFVTMFQIDNTYEIIKGFNDNRD